MTRLADEEIRDVLARAEEKVDDIQDGRAPSDRLLAALEGNEALLESVRRLGGLNLPNWYLGAGCIAQTIWNAAHAKPATADISDYDIVYFDSDLTVEAELEAKESVRGLLADLPIRPDVKNQARVHLWYGARFGYEIHPYASCEDAIATWPTTATAIAIRWVHGTLAVVAPYGTRDLFELIVRPNRVQITPAIFARKVERWARCWPHLRILSWEHGVGTPGSRLAMQRRHADPPKPAGS